MKTFKIHNILRLLALKGGVGSLLFLSLLLAPCTFYAKEKKPKVVKIGTLYKNAKTALKNQSGQDAARDALLGAVNRTELNNKKRADIYFTAALLEESLNGIENRKAFLKQPYDTAKFFNKLCDMYGQLRLCDSIDLLPDAKGKVHASYQKKTEALRLKHRQNIFMGGKFFLTKKNYAAAYPFFDNYCTYRDSKQNDTLYQHAVLWATVSAFQVNNYLGTIKNADVAISYTDSATAAIIQEYKVRSFDKLSNTNAWVDALEQGVLSYPEHDYFFVQLADWYHEQQSYSEERQLADLVIAKTGGKSIHYLARSKCYLAEKDYDACIANADSAIALQPDLSEAYYNKGLAYLNKVATCEELSCKDIKDPKYLTDKQEIQELYRQARPCMEKVRQLQPDKQDLWAQHLYRIYLNLNLGDEFSEIDRLLKNKN